MLYSANIPDQFIAYIELQNPVNIPDPFTNILWELHSVNIPDQVIAYSKLCNPVNIPYPLQPGFTADALNKM